PYDVMQMIDEARRRYDSARHANRARLVRYEHSDAASEGMYLDLDLEECQARVPTSEGVRRRCTVAHIPTKQRIRRDIPSVVHQHQRRVCKYRKHDVRHLHTWRDVPRLPHPTLEPSRNA